MTLGARTYLLTLGALVGCLDVAEVLPPTITPPGVILPPEGSSARPSVSAALHLHGWSNHSGSSQPASISWLTHQYAAAGVEFLWWTDHSDIYFHRVVDFTVTPMGVASVGPGLWTIGTWGPRAGGRAFVRSAQAPFVDSLSGRVDVPIPVGDSSQRDTVELFFGQITANGVRRATFGVLARPLVGQPEFTMTVWTLDRTPRFPDTQVLVPLAWHPGRAGGSRQVLQYSIEDSANASVAAREDTLELRRGWFGHDSGVVTLRPAVDATILPDGIDNTTDEYRIRFIVTRMQAARSVSFTLPKVVNSASTATVQMTPATEFAHAAAKKYGVTAIWGLEVGPQAGAIQDTRWYRVSGAGTHLALYLPQDASAALEASLTGTAAAYSALAQSLGGLTSIAHPFGTSIVAPVAAEAQQLDEARQLGAFLVQNGAWGASLIEVGYLHRGGVALRAHLHLLDYLWASGLQVCGVGVTDSHGGPLVADAKPGREGQYNFVTWIGGVDRVATGAELIHALRACNLSFGNPFYTRGGMWISVARDSLGRQILSLDAGGVSPSADLFLYEAEVDSTGRGHDPVYRAYGRTVSRSQNAAVGGCREGFARIEAWVGTRPLAFSNVVRLTPDPSACATGTS